MHTLANSENQDEMPQAALQYGLYCLLRQKWSSEKEIQLYLDPDRSASVGRDLGLGSNGY